MASLKEELDIIDHSVQKRAYFTSLLLNDKELIPELLELCNQVDKEISCKASWCLEFLCKKDLEVITNYLDDLLLIIPKVYKHPAVRPMAKIIEYITHSVYKEKNAIIMKALTTSHREKMVEFCFDWLITDQKVAAKAYAMTSLYLFGLEFDWIHQELATILKKDYQSQSAAYKARTRIILKKIDSKTILKT